MGHEFIGVVESIGTDVRTVKKGDLVVGLEMGILTPIPGFGNVVWYAASGLR
jgi:NADPH:quinone reductase-like Zn-dependent oxidoreductase